LSPQLSLKEDIKMTKLIRYTIESIVYAYALHMLLFPEQHSLLYVAWILPAAFAAAGMIGNMFSGDDQKEYTREDLAKYGYDFMDTGKAKGDLSRMISARLKGRRSGIDAKNKQQGSKTATDVYSNEEDLINAEVEGMSRIDEEKRMEDQAVAKTLFQMNAGREEESMFDKGFAGALTGASLGLGLDNALSSDLPEGTDLDITEKTGNLSSLSDKISNLPGSTDNGVGGIADKIVGGRRKSGTYNSLFSGKKLFNGITEQDYINYLQNKK
jgi:hypothetical protein